MTRYTEDLERRGMSAQSAEIKGATFEKLKSAAKHLKFSEPMHGFYVPGRIEVLGKHTDYAGGRSLLCCAERGFCVLAGARRDDMVRFVDVAAGETAEWPLTHEPFEIPRHWATYPATVTRRIARNFPSAKAGVDVVFNSDLPRAAGMSSSSALVTASFFAVAAINSLHETDEFQRNLKTKESLATYLACIENGSSFGQLSGDRGVGTFGGSEDHTAILCCEPGKLSRFSFCPIEFEEGLQIPDDLTFVIAVSGISADKTGGAQEKYNRLALGVSSILRLWNDTQGQQHDSLRSALASSPDARDQMRALLRDHVESNVKDGFLWHRFEQFLSESCEIIPQATVAFSQRDWNRFSELVDLSQSQAEMLLKNQIAETSFLARSARELGAVAASAFGAGFGGSVWSLIPKNDSSQFIEHWSNRFRERFPAAQSRAHFFVTAAGPAAQQFAPHSI